MLVESERFWKAAGARERSDALTSSLARSLRFASMQALFAARRTESSATGFTAGARGSQRSTFGFDAVRDPQFTELQPHKYRDVQPCAVEPTPAATRMSEGRGAAPATMNFVG